MFESIKFQNFKALRDTTLPLSRFTLIVGPNGSGKSTALNAFLAMRQPNQRNFQQVRTAGVQETEIVALTAKWSETRNDFMMRVQWTRNGASGLTGQPIPPNSMGKHDNPVKCINGARLFSLDAGAIALPVQLQPQMELQPSGAFLAGVLDRLRDQNPERFEALNKELMRWIPEFDKILFDTPGQGQDRSRFGRARVVTR